MRSLAVSFPREVRTNDWFRERHPDVVARAEEHTLAKLWTGKTTTTDATRAFDAAMAPYLSDPFRGSVQRYALGPEERSLDLQVDASRRALAAAGLGPSDVDLTICSTFYADQLDVGNGAFLAGALGLRGGMFNLEAACASSVIALHTAAALVRAGAYDNILVAVACRYSHVTNTSDTLSWFLADGAGAFVVGRAREGEGVLGQHTVHTAETCGAFYPELEVLPSGQPAVRMRADKKAGETLRAYSEVHLRACVAGALTSGGVSLSDIDFFVFNTPTAWFAAFAASALGVDPERVANVYPKTANIGPALMPAGLHESASAERIKPGDLVLLYAVGSVSSASAVVMRWGDVSLA
jgi:3-oxoacyl-[acyl-carrier-protein] synthase-3